MKTAFFILVGLLIALPPSFGQSDMRGIETKLTSSKTRQWILIDQKEVLGEQCDNGWVFTFAKTPKRVQVKECVGGQWQTSVQSWSIQIKNGVEPMLLLSNKTSYPLRFVMQNGTELLRLTIAGKRPTDPTTFYYFKVVQ